MYVCYRQGAATEEIARGSGREVVMREDDERAAAERSRQPALFEIGGDGKVRGGVATLPALGAASPLTVARYWYRRHLEQGGHARNTVESYSYDLALFELQVGPKAIEAIKPRDIAYWKCQNSVHADVTDLLLPTFAAIRGVLRAVVPVQRRDLRCQPPLFRRFAASWAGEHRVLTLPTVTVKLCPGARGPRPPGSSATRSGPG